MLITVDKKITEEADVARIVEQSLALPEPFNVPTVVLRPHEYGLTRLSPFYDMARAMKDDLVRVLYSERPLSGFLNRLGLWGQVLIHNTYILYKSYRIKAKSSLDGRSADIHFASAAPYPPDFIDDMKRLSGDYREPGFNTVIMPRLDSYLGQFVSTSLGFRATGLPADPALDLLAGFMVLWHEYAHGTGAQEPQAEAMAGVVFRKTFPDSGFLDFWTDFRTVRKVLYTGEDDLLRHSWAMVDFMDEVIAMPQEKIDSMSEEDIRNIRLKRHYNYRNEVLAVRGMLEEETGYDPKKPDVGRLASLAQVAAGYDFQDQTTNRIAKRFALAAKRISDNFKVAAPEPSLLPAPN